MAAHLRFDPSPTVVKRIEKWVTVTRRNQRIRRTFAAMTLLLLAAAGAALHATIQAQTSSTEALRRRDEARQATVESGRRTEEVLAGG